MLTPHQGLSGFMGLEKPLDQLEGKRKVLEAEPSRCQHSQNISKSRKWWECSLQCIRKQSHTTDSSCVLWLGKPPALWAFPPCGGFWNPPQAWKNPRWLDNLGSPVGLLLSRGIIFVLKGWRESMGSLRGRKNFPRD